MPYLTCKPVDHAVSPDKQSAKRHYGSHPYFTKRAWNVVQSYIAHFSAPGDTVLDPFGGSGVTAAECLVLRRKAVYVDVSAWATFLARQTAVAPVLLDRLQAAFAALEERCRPPLEQLWTVSEAELADRPVADWYPKDVPLPANADVRFVHELFTPRMLHGLAHLRAKIMECGDPMIRDLLLLAFSATLVRINTTFLSATNRRESRGGTSIFSIYRYKVAKEPVTLPLWPQFARRVRRLMEAKEETNRLIGGYYREGETATFAHGSATRLLDIVRPASVDYIYTDPPYGGHIAYLDLSTMWAAWLGFPIRNEDRSEEVIEGGQLRKTRADYERLLGESLAQMYAVLKRGAWMSLVFAHRDPSYWVAVVDACRRAGFRYVNTVVQPVGVVWSMHKKKNPLRVLSGELVLNFYKPTHNGSPAPLPRTRRGGVPKVVRECCEGLILEGVGATTEQLHHVLIPALLESGKLAEASDQYPDLIALLETHFDFDRKSGKWHLRPGHRPRDARLSALVSYHVARFLRESRERGQPPDTSEVRAYVQGQLGFEGKRAAALIGRSLRRAGTCPDGQHWLPRADGKQGELF